MSHVCDCGKRYSNLDALTACQKANHGLPVKPPMADGFAVGLSADDKIEFTLNDANGNPMAVAKMLPVDLPEFISTIVSLAGHDTLGRDLAVTLRNAQTLSR